MESSSDTRSNCIWLTATHITLLQQELAAENNLHIRRVSALDSRNSRGYDTLVFVSSEVEARPRAVTLYDGQWFELHHDRGSRQPYLNPSRQDIHQHDRPINNKLDSETDEEAGLS